jgi:hypothetical protein
MTKSSTPKALAEKAHPGRRKVASKVVAQKVRDTHRKTALKLAVEKAHVQRKIAPKVASGKAADTHREIVAQVQEFRDTQVPDSMRALTERRVAQTRQLYERSKNTLRAMLESWEKSFGAAGQGAVALNHKIIDIAERNINAAFDLAASLAGVKNLAQARELQAAYWRKRFGDLSAQLEEVRALTTEVSGNVAEPLQRQVTQWMRP